MAGPSRLSGGERNLQAATFLRFHVGRSSGYVTFHSVRTWALRLEEGYKVLIKIDNGRNVARMLDFDLERLLKEIKMDASQALDLIEAVVRFCVDRETTNKEGNLVFPERLQNTAIELAHLQEMETATEFSFTELIDEYIRFSAILPVLRKRTETVMFGDRPLLSSTTANRVSLILDIKRSGITIETIEGALAFWADGTITPPVSANVVQVSDLVRDLM